MKLKKTLYNIFILPLFIGYRYLLSPILGQSCRFEPSCSHYSQQAFEKHSFLRAAWLTIWRLLRCNPWGGCGHDPVPTSEPAKMPEKQQKI